MCREKTAVIDIGTNSVRLLVARKGLPVTVLHKELATTRLGEGILTSNRLLPCAMERTADAVAAFCRMARGEGVQPDALYVYATAAAREAENGDEFRQLLEARSGARLELLSGEQEALIAFLGASGGRKSCAVIDIGGGSTEVICASPAVHALSQKIGCVRLAERFPFPEGRVDDTAAVQEYCNTFLPAYENTGVRGAAELIGVSGTPTSFACLLQGKRGYDPSLLREYRMFRADMDKLVDELAKMPLEARREVMGGFAERADILVYGGCLLSAFMHFFGFESLLVSDTDSLEGFLAWKQGQES